MNIYIYIFIIIYIYIWLGFYSRIGCFCVLFLMYDWVAMIGWLCFWTLDDLVYKSNQRKHTGTIMHCGIISGKLSNVVVTRTMTMIVNVADGTYRYNKWTCCIPAHACRKVLCKVCCFFENCCPWNIQFSWKRPHLRATVALWVLVACLLHTHVVFSYPHFHYSSIWRFWQRFAPDLSCVGPGVWECVVLPSIMAHSLGRGTVISQHPKNHFMFIKNKTRKLT